MIAASAALLLAGCGTDSHSKPGQLEAPHEAAAPSSPTVPQASQPQGEFDLVVFCDAAAPLMVTVPREFVGTPEHVALLDDLRAVSTPEIAALVTMLRDHYEFDVDVADPESQNFRKLPA